ncbi:MAG: hydrogenase formation protein HypD [Candidatus Altiarchaeota archaeon]
MDERKAIDTHLRRIGETAADIGADITIMEICGGHTNVIMRYGIRDILPKNVRLISGPGCPVCVTPQRDIDCVIELAMCGIPVATYGDMMRVPGSRHSLEQARARGGRVFEVYSATEAVTLKKAHPDTAFFGIGFETTAPMTAYLLENGVSVYSSHRLVPPALEALMAGEVRVDGFIDPGHVSTIIGVKPYRRIKVPQVISGFTPERILRGIMLLLELIRDGRDIVVNGYPEAVKEEGNRKARRLLERHFTHSDCEWRGLGTIPKSGLEVRDGSLDAKAVHKALLDRVPAPKKTGCRCGEILKGLIQPTGCPLYRRACSPEHPKGACMVSEEGSCAIYYRFGK